MSNKLLIIFLCLTVFVLAIIQCDKGQTVNGKLNVGVSILPLADFTRQVGGDKVSIEILVPPGSSPHTFEPTAKQLQALNKARVLVLNGLGLEFWADKVINALNNPGLKVIKTGLRLRARKGDNTEYVSELKFLCDAKVSDVKADYEDGLLTLDVPFDCPDPFKDVDSIKL